MGERHVLIAGASGVIGAAAVAAFARAGWRVTAVSRRRPVVAVGGWTHAALDLDDPAACAAAVAAMPPVTHLVYAAVAEAPGLVAGWGDAGLIARNGAMFAAILDPLAARGDLVHVGLLQGTKAYGAHRHPVPVPLREDAPRDDHPNFYWLHEDHARAAAARHGFAVTIWRPQVLIGSAPGAAMNLAAPIGAYAAICRETGRPFAYPGAPLAVMELADAGLLADAMLWAADDPAGCAGIFNVTNGDVFVPRDAWPRIAAALGLPPAGDAAGGFVAFFEEPGVRAAWARLAARHALRVADLPGLLGQSHHYADLLTGARIAGRGVPVLVSTIRLRRAGFAGCRDSADAMVAAIADMAALGLLPPFDAPSFIPARQEPATP